jgi:hypothetical protein
MREILIAMILMGTALQAEEKIWRYIGPGSVKPLQMIPDRRDPNLWFRIHTNNPNESGALYRSTDGANSWQATSIKRNALQVLIHPKTSEVIVIAQ